MKTYFGVRFAALAALGLVAMGARAEAATISFNPASQNINVGQQTFVDIVVGLEQDEAVGGVYLDLTFDDNILNGVSYANDPTAKMGLAACEAEAAADVEQDEPYCEFSAGFSPSNLNLNFLANDELDFNALKLLQGASFILARLVFEGAAPGTSDFTFFDAFALQLSDAEGDALLVAQVGDGSITVNGVVPPGEVPEPGTIMLFGAGAAVMLARRFRRSRS